MPKIKPKHAIDKQIFQQFGGIGSTSDSNRLSFSTLDNFRILADGSLEKRCGFGEKHQFRDTLYAVWQGYVDNQYELFFAVGNTLCKDTVLGAIPIYTLPSPPKKAQFFFYSNHLYFLDGTQIYVYRPIQNTFAPASGYAPLVGMNWSPTSLGEYYEPFNLFTNRMRVSYRNFEQATVYHLPYSAESIDCIYADGMPVVDFTFRQGDPYFSVNQVYSWLDVGFTARKSTQTIEFLCGSTESFCDRFNGNEYLFLFGGSVGNYLFGTSVIPENRLNASISMFRDSDPLYFPADMQLALGTESHPITALFKNHDRLLAFYDSGGYAVHLAEDADKLYSYPILAGIGCTSSIPYIGLQNETLLINASGVFFLNSPSHDHDDFSLTPIGESIPALRDPVFVKNALVFYDHTHEELWLFNRSGGQTSYIYHVPSKHIYTFSGFTPSFFISYQGRVGFAQDNKLFVFDEELSSDNGKAIVATAKTMPLFTDTAETVKRSLRASVLAKNKGNKLTLALITEKSSQTVSFSGRLLSTMPVLYDHRVAPGRFQLLTALLTDSSMYRPRIYRLAFFAKT